MKSRLALLFFLLAFSFEGLVNKTVGAGLVPARCRLSERGQRTCPCPLQNSSQDLLFVMLKPDGVNAVTQRRRKRHHRKTQRRAKVYGIKVSPDEGGAMPPEPSQQEYPTSAAPPPPPVQANPGMDAPGGGRPSTPAKKSAPRIKPPTVMIKPPTE